MGIKAKHILDRTNVLNITVNFEEDGQIKEGSLTVRHRILTPDLWDRIKTKSTSKDDSGDEHSEAEAKDGLISELLLLLTGWDVEGEDGNPLPIAEETLKRVDYRLLKEINTAIVAYTFPNATT